MKGMAADHTHQPTPRTIDLTGLPEPVVERVLQFAREAREKQAKEAAGATAGTRPPLRRRFEHLGYSIPKDVID